MGLNGRKNVREVEEENKAKKREKIAVKSAGVLCLGERFINNFRKLGALYC